MNVNLFDYQLAAIERMHNGCILCGDTGSGKTRTALAYYYFKECNGRIKVNGEGRYQPMKNKRDLYIITTAKKRDSKDWEFECGYFGIYKEESVGGISLTVDSWNNIKKYRNVNGQFFIFDEQHVTGSGVWVKSFLDICRKNHWILLSATPGDTWMDYVPVFVANGFYRNKTDFTSQHCIYSRYTRYPKVTGYIDEDYLYELRDRLLVHMDDIRLTEKHEILVTVDYDRMLYRTILKDRWNPYEQKPIRDMAGVIFLLRKCINTDPSRMEAVLSIMEKRKRAIIFYNFNYELEIIKEGLDSADIPYAEWNGKTHDILPHGETWAYLVQYLAGAEGWNCITADTIIYYSQNYSYRLTKQASGRIDRVNTPYKDLYYYRLKSTASIDLAIYNCYKNKKNFNESAFLS